MHVRAVALSGAFLLAVACTATDARRPGPASPSPRAASARAGAPARDDLLRRMRVWREPPVPVSSADLAANPPGPGSFGTDEDVACTFRLRHSEGWSPKFTCALPDGEEVKVKYAHNSAEVFAEVAATRLLAALGFGADRMYVVRSVRCRGCPLFPYPRLEILDALRQSSTREVRFGLADIERKMPGRTLKPEGRDGWAFPELDRVDPRAGGSSRAEVDALRLVARFINHWDNKAPNQRLVCLPGGDAGEGCTQVFGLLQDVGQTFGPRGANLEGWRAARIWADEATCLVSMKDAPYEGATFTDVRISEGGRALLGGLLRQISHAQVVALFTGARFPEFRRQPAEGLQAESWAAAFEDKVVQIVDRAPCPQ